MGKQNCCCTKIMLSYGCGFIIRARDSSFGSTNKKVVSKFDVQFPNDV